MQKLELSTHSTGLSGLSFGYDGYQGVVLTWRDPVTYRFSPLTVVLNRNSCECLVDVLFGRGLRRGEKAILYEGGDPYCIEILCWPSNEPKAAFRFECWWQDPVPDAPPMVWQDLTREQLDRLKEFMAAYVVNAAAANKAAELPAFGL